MSNWLDKLAGLPRDEDGSLISGAVEPALLPGSSRAGIWYETPYAVTNLVQLAAFVANDGAQVFVLDQNEFYTLDTGNVFHAFSPLIVARTTGTGRWFRRTKAFVVGNYTLWCESYGTGIVGFTPGQLLASGTKTPDILLSASGLPINGVQELITDTSGDLWLTFNDGFFTAVTVRKYLLRDCLSSGAIAPVVVLNVPTPVSTECGTSAFDHASRLWVANGGHGTFGVFSVERYAEADYGATGGTPEATLTIAPSPSTSNTQNICFDHAGNMWASLGFVGSGGGLNGGILMFTPAQLESAAIGMAPQVSWIGSNFTGTAIASTNGLAVSPDGTQLWCCNYPDNKIRAWSIVGASSGNPPPAVVLTSASFNKPYTAVFDASGNLWTQNALDSRLLRISKANLGASGSVVPDVIITSTVPLGTLCFPNSSDRSGVLPVS
jgi:hypothetical protein